MPVRVGVSDGARTRDILDHNQVLYLLSYTHHGRPGPGGRRDQSTGPTSMPRTAFAASLAWSDVGPGCGTNSVRR